MPLPDGRQCLKSVERKIACVDGHVWTERRPIYRFQLKLADGSMQGRTVKATVFNSASAILLRNAKEFRALSFSGQERSVLDACREEPRVVVTIRTYDGKAVIEQLLSSNATDASLDIVVEPEPQPSIMRQILDRDYSSAGHSSMGSHVAVVGQHYQIYKRSKFGFLYVCLQGDCARNARNAGRFEPHMKQHGFTGIDHAANERVLLELKNLTTGRQCKPRRSKSTPTRKDFLHLRSSLRAAWTQATKRKWTSFVNEAKSSALFRFGPEPKAPEQTVFTVMIDALLLIDRRQDAGFWAERWNFDMQDCVITSCTKTTPVYSWCETIETQLRLQQDQWPSPELAPKVRAAVKAMKGIFPQIGGAEPEHVRSFMTPIRKALVKSGLCHIEWLRKTLEWLQNCSPERIHARAKKLHDQWLKESKCAVMLKLRSNLLRKFNGQFLTSEEEAIAQAGLDDLLLSNDSDVAFVADSVERSEISVSVEKNSHDTPGHSVVNVAAATEPMQVSGENVLPTPDKWIVKAYSSDEEPFLRRLSTIYVDEDGVGSQPEGLWPSEATEVLLSQVVRDLRATFASQNADV
ncbi:hypothetical protein R1sor_023067 [Riccia sorocarpa]|uniref:C2H2-type domain-containing protein n=1 Tax=Riccia sorocarpa TaxID=122646 RepID=A0ABD3GQK6_9MARC